MADDRAAEIATAARLEPAFAGSVKRAALLVEILCVCVYRILREKADRIVVICICAGKVADIHQCAEIVVIYSIDKLFYSVGVLSKEAVVFDTGFDTLGFSIFGNLAICSCKDGKNGIEALPFVAAVITGGSIVTHCKTAVSCSNVNKLFNASDFRIGVSVKEIGANAEANCLNTDFLTVVADILRVCEIALVILGISRGFDKVYAFAAEFLYLIDTALDSERIIGIVAVEAVKPIFIIVYLYVIFNFSLKLFRESSSSQQYR